MRGIIYGYYQPITEKWYVGKTIQESGRKSAHKGSKGRSSKTHFGRAVKKYGFDSFDYHILFEFITDDIDLMNKTLSDKEIYFIELKDSYNNGYNLTLGGEGAAGAKRTDEWKKEHSVRMMGVNKGNKNSLGHKHSEETKKKLSIARKGKSYGYSENGLKKKIDGLVKRLSKPIIQYDLNGNKISEHISATEASKIINRNRKSISDCLCGRQKTAYGFIWKYDLKTMLNKTNK